MEIADIPGTFAKVQASLDAVVGPATLLLADLRDGPSNNDPAFERDAHEPVKQLWGRFARRAVLVRTAAGLLHVERLSADRGFQAETQRTFRDEAEALAWLTGAPPA